MTHSRVEYKSFYTVTTNLFYDGINDIKVNRFIANSFKHAEEINSRFDYCGIESIAIFCESTGEEIELL